jgi:hypothetical protein
MGMGRWNEAIRSGGFFIFTGSDYARSGKSKLTGHWSREELANARNNCINYSSQVYEHLETRQSTREITLHRQSPHDRRTEREKPA